MKTKPNQLSQNKTNTKKTKEIYIISILILTFSILVINFINHTPILMWDEPVYLSNALSHLVETHFTEDYRFPLLEYFIAATWLITGISVKSAQILMLIFSISTLILFHSISKIIIKKTHLQILSTSLLAFSYIFLYWSYRIYSDIASLAFLLASIYTFFIYHINEKKKEEIQNEKKEGKNQKTTIEKNKLKKILTTYNSEILILLSGITTSLAFLMRYSSAISALLIVPTLLYKKNIKHLIIYSIGNGIILLPWLIYNFITYNNPLWDLIAQKEIIDTYTSWEPISTFAFYLITSSSTLIVFLLIFIFFYIKNSKIKKNFFINFTFVLLILSILYYSLAVNLKLQRYQLMILPFIILLSIFTIEKIINTIQTSKLKKNIKLFLFISLTLIFMIHIYVNVNQATTKIYEEYSWKENSSSYQSIEYIKENVPAGEVVISNAWTWYGFYGNHKARSIWDPNINKILYDTNKGYLVINNNYQIPFEKLEFNGELIQNITDSNGNNVLIYYIYNK